MDGFFVAAVAGLGAALLLIAAAEVTLKFHIFKATISHTRYFLFQFLTVLRSCTMAVGCEFLMSEKTKATTDPGILQKGRQMGKKYEKIQLSTLHMFLFLKKVYFPLSGCYP